MKEEGYVTEIDYARSFIREMSPSGLSFVASILGFEAPSTKGAFRYLELGCGRGFTTNLLAACHPNAEFVANDFNARQIDEANALARAAGLSNVTFLPSSFEGLLTEDIGEFDFIGLHGVLSWVSAENRAFLHRTIRDRLRPGGLFYVGYNCEPGWAAVEPLRRLLNEDAKRRSGPLDERIRESIAFIQKLESGLGYFTQTPVAASRFTSSARHGASYIAHEFFGSDWRPRYHLDVCRELAALGLTYLGTTSLVRNTDLVIPEEILPTFQAIEDRDWKEQVRDYVMNRPFRADVYRRGGRRMTEEEHREWRMNVKLCLGARRDNFDFRVSVPPVELSLDRTVYEKLFEVLADGPLSSREVAARSRGVLSEEDVHEACFLTDIVQPATTSEGPVRETCQRFNHVLIDEALRGVDVQALASPVLGSGVPLETVEVLALAAMSGRGSRDALRERLTNDARERFDRVFDKHAIWASLGLVPPSG